MRTLKEANPLALGLLFALPAILLLIQSAAMLRSGYQFLHYVCRSHQSPPGDFMPRVTVIIPCKGVDTGFEMNVERLLAQDYPGYQLIFVVAEERDPAYAVLASLLEKAAKPKGDVTSATAQTSLRVAGLSDQRGEKVNNLLCGIATADQSSEILVFADADARPSRDWLRSLVAPLADPGVTVSTGFRWYLPGPGFVSQLRAAWDTSNATLLDEHNAVFAWGGSMAMRSVDFRRLDIAGRYWARTVSDDYAVTRAVRDAKGRIRFEPRCLVASHEESTLREFLSWSTRQIILTRVYAPRLWLLGLVAHGFYCLTFLLGLAALILPVISQPWKIAILSPLLLVLLLGMVKGHARTAVARELFVDEAETLARYGGRYWQLSPLVPWVMFFNFVVAAFQRRIRWRGTEYELRSADEVKVIRRDPD